MTRRLAGLAALCALLLVLARPAAADLRVDAGWDLLETLPGTSFMGLPFQGVPLGNFDFGPPFGVQATGLTDTIIRRLDDAVVPMVGDSDTIPIEIVGLQLVSSNPIDLGAGLGFYFITLQSIRGGPASTGEMTITFGPEMPNPFPHSIFDSFFDVFFDIRLGGMSGPIVISDSLRMTASGVPWNHFPPPDAVEIDGVNTSLNGQNRNADFWPLGAFQEVHPAGVAIHVVRTGTRIIPEPSTFALLAVGGLLGLVFRRHR
jgi:hypothetical protein